MTPPYSDRELIHRVTEELAAFLEHRIATLNEIDPRCADLAERLRSFVLDGGKRMRPRFAYAAFLACGLDDAAVTVTKKETLSHEHAVRAVSALELIQACALIHDDIVDDSATRRGTPTVHVQMAQRHRADHMHGDANHYGRAQAILLGDIALSWADEMFSTALLDAPGVSGTLLRSTHAVWAEMKNEVLGGQMLDIFAEASGAADLDTPQRVSRYKTAAYTIERPVHLGAVMAGADAATIAELRRFGVDTGIAFQHIDDLLGVFGDPDVTGKPSGDDLREGKRTLLLNYALAHAEPAAAAELNTLVGAELDPDQLARAREILDASGAHDHVRAEAHRLINAAAETLDPLPLSPIGKAMLQSLADRAVNRAF